MPHTHSQLIAMPIVPHNCTMRLSAVKNITRKRVLITDNQTTLLGSKQFPVSLFPPQP